MDRFAVERGRCEIILGLFIFLTVSNAQLSVHFPRKLLCCSLCVPLSLSLFLFICSTRMCTDKMLIRSVLPTSTYRIDYWTHTHTPDSSIHTFSTTISRKYPKAIDVFNFSFRFLSFLSYLSFWLLFCPIIVHSLWRASSWHRGQKQADKNFIAISNALQALNLLDFQCCVPLLLNIFFFHLQFGVVHVRCLVKHYCLIVFFFFAALDNRKCLHTRREP